MSRSNAFAFTAPVTPLQGLCGNGQAIDYVCSSAQTADTNQPHNQTDQTLATIGQDSPLTANAAQGWNSIFKM